MMNPAQPYRSQRSPVLAKNVVATSHPLAAQAGLSMIAKGGNAVDAALAAAICLTVVEPTSNGIGSDAFAIIWDGKKLDGLNASGRAPLGWSREYFAHKYGSDAKELPLRGIDTVTVPGCVSAWVALSKRYGKLPFEDLFESAIRYARDGHLVAPVTGASWARQLQLIASKDMLRDFAIDGHAPIVGTVWKQADQAKTLELIAQTNGEAFYRGELSRAIVQHARSLGGVQSESDFANHAADWVDLISTRYRGHDVYEIPPNGQGIAALMALGILEHRDLAIHAQDGIESVHLQLEAMKLAFADVYAEVADRKHMRVRIEDLLSDAYLKSRAMQIQMARAQSFTTEVPKHGGTVYLTAADESGMMISMIQSNYLGFGSGVVVPGTGISLQNRGHGFNRIAGHPNEVGAGKRPFHTIIPSFVMRDGKPFMSFGVMGGHVQPQGHVQMLVRMLDYGLNPQAASDAPRWTVNPDATVSLESGTPQQTIDGLKVLGHNVVTPAMADFAFGGAQLIQRVEGGYVAGSDHRKDGCAVGF
jgi:gamma-glutamyltranspeptidase / glutathione hydrolase